MTSGDPANRAPALRQIRKSTTATNRAKAPIIPATSTFTSTVIRGFAIGRHPRATPAQPVGCVFASALRISRRSQIYRPTFCVLETRPAASPASLSAVVSYPALAWPIRAASTALLRVWCDVSLSAGIQQPAGSASGGARVGRFTSRSRVRVCGSTTGVGPSA